MDAVEKKALAAKAIHAFLTGDSETSEQILADDASWWACKSLSSFMPLLTNKADIIARNAGTREIFPEGLKTTIHNVYCDGDTMIVEFSNYGKAANGRIYDQDYCVLFLVQGDKIKEIREHQDSLHVHQTFFA
jgi:uncharacterized protein